MTNDSFSSLVNVLDLSGASQCGELRVGLIGTGVVGSGICQVLSRNADLIAHRLGRPIRLVMAAARNLQKAAQVVGPEVTLVTNPFDLVRHPNIDVVVEVMGGVTLAKDLVLEAIAHGKHVVTANKALLAVHGSEIFAAAEAKSVIVAYEGAVAVSIPIIKVLREGLAANQIHEVLGIVNGTTNFILTQMQEEGASFELALRLATELGFAEADPFLDVEGIDAAHKTALLAAIAFGADVTFDQVHAEGITNLNPWDMACAQVVGYRIKLLGIARRRGEAIEVRVHPALVPEEHSLSRVQGSMNGIWVNVDSAGPTFHYGAGAGSQTTASAVVADLMDVGRQALMPCSARVPYRSVQNKAVRVLPVLPIEQVVSPHYLRFALFERPELLHCLSDWLQGVGFEIVRWAHVHHPVDHTKEAWVVLTQSMTGADLKQKLQLLREGPMDVVPAASWRVEDLSS